MKLNAAIVFITSIASGAYAAGNLRSRQNLSHIQPKDVQSPVDVKHVVQIKKSPDGSRLLEESQATIEKHRRMHSEDWFYAMTRQDTAKYSVKDNEKDSSLDEEDAYRIMDTEYEEGRGDESTILGGVRSAEDAFPYFGTFCLLLLLTIGD